MGPVEVVVHRRAGPHLGRAAGGAAATAAAAEARLPDQRVHEIRVIAVDPAIEYRDRHAGTRRSDVRVISVAYLALVREQLAGAGARSHWQPVYACLPWEDRRAGRASLLEETLLPGLHSWSVRRPFRHEKGPANTGPKFEIFVSEREFSRK